MNISAALSVSSTSVTLSQEIPARASLNLSTLISEKFREYVSSFGAFLLLGKFNTDSSYKMIRERIYADPSLQNIFRGFSGPYMINTLLATR